MSCFGEERLQSRKEHVVFLLITSVPESVVWRYSPQRAWHLHHHRTPRGKESQKYVSSWTDHLGVPDGRRKGESESKGFFFFKFNKGPHLPTKAPSLNVVTQAVK